MACLSHVLETPEAHGHFLQLHGDDIAPLAENVARYLSEGLKRGEGAVVIATPEHRVAFVLEMEKLGVDTELALSESSLLLLDAQRTLGEFMIEGQPDGDRFRRVITAAIAKVQAAGRTGLRAYGEMVGILWTAGEYSTATRLEELWNNLLQGGGFTLFCSYPIDIFAEDFQTSSVDALLRDHTHLMPTGADDAVEGAIHRAMDECLGSRASGLRLAVKDRYRSSWAVLPKAEGTILWLRENLPNEAENILSLARKHYGASEHATASL